MRKRSQTHKHTSRTSSRLTHNQHSCILRRQSNLTRPRTSQSTCGRRGCNCRRSLRGCASCRFSTNMRGSATTGEWMGRAQRPGRSEGNVISEFRDPLDLYGTMQVFGGACFGLYLDFSLPWTARHRILSSQTNDMSRCDRSTCLSACLVLCKAIVGASCGVFPLAGWRLGNCHANPCQSILST